MSKRAFLTGIAALAAAGVYWNSTRLPKDLNLTWSLQQSPILSIAPQVEPFDPTGRLYKMAGQATVDVRISVDGIESTMYHGPLVGEGKIMPWPLVAKGKPMPSLETFLLQRGVLGSEGFPKDDAGFSYRVWVPEDMKNRIIKVSYTIDPENKIPEADEQDNERSFVLTTEQLELLASRRAQDRRAEIENEAMASRLRAAGYTVEKLR